MIIGLTGKKGSGKTTAAQFLVDAGWSRYSFADPMRVMLNELLSDLGLSQNERRTAMHDKEAVIPALGVSFRHLMQTLGTEWGRQLIDPELWIKCQRFRLEKRWVEDRIVYDDIRFENEAALIRSLGGKIVHIIRPGLDNADGHVSESGINVVAGDLRISNESSINCLIDCVLSVVREAAL